MRTTINALVGRPDPTCAPASVDETLESARRVFADVTRFLEGEIDRLYDMNLDPDDPAERERLRTIQDLIKQNQAALRTMLEIRARLGQCDREEKRQLIDLEAARDEILRRLDRLARRH